MTRDFYQGHGYNWQTNSDALFRRAWHLLFTEAQESMGNLEGIKLMDAGCGKGEFYPYVSSSSYYGIDISKDNIERAKEHFDKGSFLVGDVSKMEFDDDFFDALVSTEVIEHLTLNQLSEFLGEVKRVTKKGGRVVFTTPNLYYLWGTIPWSFCPVRRRMSLWKFAKGMVNGFVDENYNLPVHHYRFKPSFLKGVINEFLDVKNIKSTYWYNNRAIHGLLPEFQLKVLNFSNRIKFKPLLLGQQLIIECENNK